MRRLEGAASHVAPLCSSVIVCQRGGGEIGGLRGGRERGKTKTKSARGATHPHPHHAPTPTPPVLTQPACRPARLFKGPSSPEFVRGTPVPLDSGTLTSATGTGTSSGGGGCAAARGGSGKSRFCVLESVAGGTGAGGCGLMFLCAGAAGGAGASGG